jgi:hypothetical protein
MFFFTTTYTYVRQHVQAIASYAWEYPERWSMIKSSLAKLFYSISEKKITYFYWFWQVGPMSVKVPVPRTTANMTIDEQTARSRIHNSGTETTRSSLEPSRSECKESAQDAGCEHAPVSFVSMAHVCGHFGHFRSAADPINRGPPSLLPAVAADYEVGFTRGRERERERERAKPASFPAVSPHPFFPASACAFDLAGKSPSLPLF